MTTNGPVLIVGAGPTGLTAASLLAGYGISTLVLDRRLEAYPQPRAVHLDDEVYRILGRLGLGPAFATISRPAEGLRLLAADLTVLAEFSRDREAGRHGFPQANLFDQPDLEAILRQNLKQRPEATFRGGCEVTSIRPGEDGVQVGYTDLASGTEHTVEAGYLLGCDGANSVVRSAIGANLAELGFAQRWLVVDVHTDLDLGAWEGVHQICDPHRAGTFMRIAPARYRWEFRLRDGESAADFRGAGVRALIDRWLPAGARGPGTADDDVTVLRLAEYTFRAQVADHWRAGRVFLLGDAAHLTPPFIGQGLGAGLRDAMNLCWKLAGVLDRSLPPSWLDTYQREREPHIRGLIRLAIGLGVAMTAGGRTGDVLRRRVAPRLHLVPGLRTRVLDSSTPRLRCGSPRQRLRHPLIGTLCPNAVLPSGGRLDDLRVDGFVIVSRDRPTSGQLETARDRGGFVLHAAAGSPWTGWLRRGRTRVALVRPDGVVASCHRHLDDALAALPVFRPGRQ